MYKVKNFKEADHGALQQKVKEWIESRASVEIVSVNMWYDGYDKVNLGTVVYLYREY